jgi:hypothetical protein
MSLAMYAAPFDDNLKEENNDTIMNRKRQHTKTQKMYPKGNTEKVNSVLEKIHENPTDSSLDGDLGDFNHPPPPQSSGVTKTVTTEQMHNMSSENNMNMFKVTGKPPQPTYNNSENDLELNNFNSNYGDSKSVEDYYNRVLPGYKPQNNKNPINRQYYANGQVNEQIGQDVLVQKLNYMINLLEEKQDERTNNVTEEVVLYSFLGIFIIFVVDSFARAGKYTR